jgi:hypothetical protein
MRTIVQTLFAIWPIALALASGCGDNNTANTGVIDARVTDPVIDASSTPDASCYNNPQTYTEIINACSTAAKIFKPGKPPLLNADGSLPPLP